MGRKTIPEAVVRRVEREVRAEISMRLSDARAAILIVEPDAALGLDVETRAREALTGIDLVAVHVRDIDAGTHCAAQPYLWAAWIHGTGVDSCRSLLVELAAHHELMTYFIRCEPGPGESDLRDIDGGLVLPGPLLLECLPHALSIQRHCRAPRIEEMVRTQIGNRLGLRYPPDAVAAAGYPAHAQSRDTRALELRAALSRFGGNKTAVARHLGMSRRHLYRQLRRYKLLDSD